MATFCGSISCYGFFSRSVTSVGVIGTGSTESIGGVAGSTNGG